MRFLISFLVLITSFCSLAQDEIKVTKLPRVSARVNIGIPKVASSTALRNSFSGVMSSDINFDCRLFSNFFAGIGYNHMYFKSQKHFSEQFINTNMQMHNGYLKIGYDHFFSNSAFTTISLNSGYSLTKFAGIQYKNDSLVGKFPTSYSGSFIEPHFGITFLVEPNFGFGGYIGYHYDFSQFNPAYPGFDKWLDYSNISNKWTTSMVSIGFGFYYGISKQK